MEDGNTNFQIGESKKSVDILLHRTMSKITVASGSLNKKMNANKEPLGDILKHEKNLIDTVRKVVLNEFENCLSAQQKTP